MKFTEQYAVVVINDGTKRRRFPCEDKSDFLFALETFYDRGCIVDIESLRIDEELFQLLTSRHAHAPAPVSAAPAAPVVSGNASAANVVVAEAVPAA